MDRSACPIADEGKEMLERDFEPSFTLKLAAKDMRLASEAAERRQMELPLLRAVSSRFEQSAEQHDDKDMSAVFLTL